jgi:hypothetical protein
MPRKQRFKPTRKPQQQQVTPPPQQMDDRREIHPDDVDIEREQPVRDDSKSTIE